MYNNYIKQKGVINLKCKHCNGTGLVKYEGIEWLVQCEVCDGYGVDNWEDKSKLDSIRIMVEIGLFYNSEDVILKDILKILNEEEE